MTKDTLTLINRGLDAIESDDLYRAESAWAGLSDEALDSEYGESGRTRRQILEGYRQRKADVDAARAELKGLGK